MARRDAAPAAQPRFLRARRVGKLNPGFQVRRRDPLTKHQRSALMSKVRGRGNASTEKKVAWAFRRFRIAGWRRHRADLPGTPDFYFERGALAVFVHGCFWHGCPRCGRFPKSNRAFWMAKILGNQWRDERDRRRLNRRGIRTITIWEHELSSERWLGRVRRHLDSRELDADASD